MTAKGDQCEDNTANLNLLPRPLQTLQDLPVRYRWEVTRRHPYYLMWWEWGQRYHAQAETDPKAIYLSQIAYEILLSIGVSGNPPPPTASSAELGASQLAKAWQGGAVAPITYRSLVARLAELPRAARLEVAEILTASCISIDQKGEQPPHSPNDLAKQLLGVKEPEFDKIPSRPIVGLNLYAPLRAIQQAIQELVDAWKKQEGITERRRRPECLSTT